MLVGIAYISAFTATPKTEEPHEKHFSDHFALCHQFLKSGDVFPLK